MNTDELIHRHIDGLLSADEAAQLSRLLETDTAARERYLELAGLHAALAADETLRVPVAPFRPVQKARTTFGRSIAQMAAGVVLGGLAVGTAWAIALPRAPKTTQIALANAGFESGSALSLGGVPDRPGRWAADLHEVVERHGKVVAREGTHMLRFLAASTEGNHVGSKWSGSDLYQVVELPGNGTRTVRIRAWFNADTEKEALFHVAAVAGAGKSGDGKELWEQRNVEGATLAFARTMTSVDHDPATWEAGELTLQVPPKACVLVIGIAAFRLRGGATQEWFPAQFVDDVSVNISEEAQ